MFIALQKPWNELRRMFSRGSTAYFDEFHHYLINLPNNFRCSAIPFLATWGYSWVLRFFKRVVSEPL